MKRRFLLTLVAMSLTAMTYSAIVKKKVIDEGGSGPYKAEAVTESSLPGFVVYRPADLSAAKVKEGQLPLLVWANGACRDSSIEHERMLNDLASYGYVVVAVGEMADSINSLPFAQAPNEKMVQGMDWAEKQTADKNSDYFGMIDMDLVALGGMSCGGAQLMANAGDPRVKTYMMMNSGMGDIEMSGASRKSLENVHGPILYILGGEGDIAYNNALKDFDRISKVPVAFASQNHVGHGGTYADPYGGSFSRMARAWLGWQFKDKRSEIDVFLHNRLNDYPDFTMKAKNFPEVNDPFTVKEVSIRSRDGKPIWGLAYIPNTPEKKKAMVIMAHGYNGTQMEPNAYAETLAMRGIASYICDFIDGSNYSKSGTSTTDMTVFTEKAQVEDIAKAVKTWDFVDPARVGLLGCSQGGLVGALTSSANPEMFKSVVLVYPALMIPDTAPMMLKKFDEDGGKPQEVMGMKLGRQYYSSINGMNILDSLPNYKGDVFIVYGDKDPVTAGGMMDSAAEKYAKSHVQVIKDATHGFPAYQHHAQASKGIADFAQKSLSQFHGYFRPEFDATDPDVHDPVMAYEDGVYYMFTTGFGIGMMSSTDMKTWKPEKAPLDPIPTWPQESVPAYKGHTWAPDIVKVGDKWYLYYSCSTFGKNISAIGVATNKTLNPNSPDYKWEDLGMVIQSIPGETDWNAIDPNIIIDRKGKPWMTFGSFWDGIQLVELKKDMKTPKGKTKTIARRRSPEKVAHLQENANFNAIEAPFITYHDGYYYLFVSFDFCCKGLGSNYKIAVGRSKNVAGPYLDKEGKDMAETGGTILAGPNDKYAGIGHCSVYEFDGKWYLAAHAYDKSKRGASKLFLREVKWENGWPVIMDK